MTLAALLGVIDPETPIQIIVPQMSAKGLEFLNDSEVSRLKVHGAIVITLEEE